MKKVSESDYGKYIFWANENTANKVYPCSIAEGFQAGGIYADDKATPGAVFFWHNCGFGYITGKPSESFLEEIYTLMTGCPAGRRLVLITSDDEVVSFFRGREVLLGERVEYSYRPQPNEAAFAAGAQYRVEAIDARNLPKIGFRIGPSFSWDSPERFLKNGFGYIALDHEKVCAAAFSAAVSSDEIDIGVETQEDYRRMGLAAMLAGRMCEHIVRIGKKPVWAHAIANKGSQNTALKCGFVPVRVNTVIRRA